MAHPSLTRVGEERLEPLTSSVGYPYAVHRRTVPMRVLYVLENPSWLRHELEVLEELATRGHEVVVACQAERDPGALLQELAARVPDARLEIAPERDSLRRVATLSRQLHDLGLYREPELRRASGRRSRWQRKATPEGPLRHAATAGFALLRAAPARPTTWALRRFELLLPPDSAHIELLRAVRPSLVVVTGLVQVGSSQADLVKAARAVQVPSVYAVASWDNLSTKGRIKETPSSVFVWNDALVDEAERFHHARRDRIVVTGSPRFDPWFEQPDTVAPASGAPDAYVLYLGSSRSIAPDEVPFVREVSRWLGRDPRTAHLRVKVLPHPQNQEQWRGIREPGLEVIDRNGFPLGSRETQLLRESLRSAQAVVAVNTSAVLEAAVLGRRVLSMRHPAFEEMFAETYHMRYLLEENGGSVHLTESPDDFVEEVARELDPATRAAAEPHVRAFASAFLRPRGSERRAASVVAEELERLADTRRQARDPLEAPAAV